MKHCLIKLFSCLLLTFAAIQTNAQDGPGFKTTMDFTIDKVGAVICQYSTKYSAINWDNFTRTIGNNTSILKNMLIRTFPKYQLSEFDYSQDANERTNKIKFKMDGMMVIGKDGKWWADLDQKNPDITKVSNSEFLLIAEGNTLKIHLPPGTDDAKVEKDSFGKAMLTYSADGGSRMGTILMILGIAMAIGGTWLLIKNMKGA